MKYSSILPVLLSMLLMTFAVEVKSIEEGYSTQPSTLRLGVFPRRNATATIALFTPLADYLSDALGRPVVLETSKDFESFWKGVRENRYDIVHYNQYHYIRSSSDYEVFASNEEFGKRTISGALFVRADNGISSIEQLYGKNIVFGGGHDAMMSHIVPRYLLQQAGLREGDYREGYSSSPPNSVMAVYFRQADAAGAGDIVPTLPIITRKIDVSSLKILKKSEPLSHLPWAMKRTLTATLRENLRKLFYDLNNTEEGRAILHSAKLTGLHPATDTDFDAHRHIITSVFGEEKH